MKLLMIFVMAVSTHIAVSQTPTPAPSPKPDDTLIQTVKAQNARATQMNALITQYNNAVAGKDWPAASEAVKQLSALDPSGDYYFVFGNAQLKAGSYDGAISAYKTYLQQAGYPANIKVADVKTRGSMAAALTNTGNAYTKLKNYADAARSFENAAEISPNPGLAYFNLCATQFNMGNIDAAVPACDKSIAADPTRADAYFVKGSALYGNGKIDANGKYVLPPGTIDALNKYLELAPNGPHVDDVKAMLDAAK